MEIDILSLVDRLEALVNAGTRVPLSGKIMVDEQEVLEILDQMRVSIPEEIKLSKRTLQERERIVAQAQMEAQNIIELAKEQADLLLDEKGLISEAQGHSAVLVREAQEEALRVRLGADNYVREILTELEDLLGRQLIAIRKGLNSLNR